MDGGVNCRSSLHDTIRNPPCLLWYILLCPLTLWFASLFYPIRLLHRLLQINLNLLKL